MEGNIGKSKGEYISDILASCSAIQQCCFPKSHVDVARPFVEHRTPRTPCKGTGNIRSLVLRVSGGVATGPNVGRSECRPNLGAQGSAFDDHLRCCRGLRLARRGIFGGGSHESDGWVRDLEHRPSSPQSTAEAQMLGEFGAVRAHVRATVRSTRIGPVASTNLDRHPSRGLPSRRTRSLTQIQVHADHSVFVFSRNPRPLICHAQLSP